MQFLSANKYLRSTAILTLVLAGCATPPPALPRDTTSVDRAQPVTADAFSKEDLALSCDQIAAEFQQIDTSMQNANDKIKGNRSSTQAALFLAGVYAMPFVATNSEDKKEINLLYSRRDTLISLSALKKCP